MFGLKAAIARHQPPWYRWLEDRLKPIQPAVIALLLLIVAVTTAVVVAGPRWLRTAWLVYLISP
ncbi:MAG TPA: hypothetical protein VJX92_13895 [Methylomirabilota bacterium]|nr:hypothetical protein [Methylomirabilota bacterium]